jgi:hypothetical protein
MTINHIKAPALFDANMLSPAGSPPNPAGGTLRKTYLAPSQAEKLQQIDAHNLPYPWEPGTVMRYRDHDFYLFGAALDAFLKSVRGPDAEGGRTHRRIPAHDDESDRSSRSVLIAD